jgi:uncharacterized protein YkwD
MPHRLLLASAVFAICGACLSASPGTSPPGPTSAVTSRPDLDPRALQRDIHDRVNQVRAEEGAAWLEWNARLHPLAHTHSADMAARDFFAHVNPDGASVRDRAAALGLTCTVPADGGAQTVGFGENLYMADLYHSYRVETRGGTSARTYDWKTHDDIVREVVAGWMNSPGHRANLLDARYRSENVALVIDDTAFYVTQVFC